MNRSESGMRRWWRLWVSGHVGVCWAVFGLLAVFCSVLVTARRVWIEGTYPREAVAVAEALGRASVLQKPPLVDEAGRRVGMIRTTERGIEVVVLDMETGEEKRLLECPDAFYDPGTAQVFDWRPNGAGLAFGMLQSVHFLDDGNGEVFPLGEWYGGVRWMEGRGWMCLRNDGLLRQFRREEGHWQVVREWNLPQLDGGVRSFHVTGRDRIAWADSKSLWEGDLEAGRWQVLWRDDRGQVRSVDYDVGRDLFLVTYSYRTNRRDMAELVAVGGSRATGWGGARVLVEEESVLDGRWLNGGEGWAYRSVRNNRPRGIVRVGGVGGVTRVLEMEAVYGICTAQEGRILFLHGSLTNEPPGLWRYEIGSDRLTCAWWPVERGVALPALQPVLSGRAPWGAGHWATFDLVPPAGYRRGKKYPLVIGLGTYEWTPIAHGVSAQALARAGAYVALVRYRWNQSRVETVYEHTNHVLAVERVMREHPSVDGGRVYLYGFSAGTLVVCRLAEMYPGRYRGLMVFNPSDLPEPVEGLTRRVLATAGQTESMERRFRRWEEELCKVGIPFEWHEHPDGQHIIRAKASLRERAVWTLDFVFGR
ncbi:hypothetical protein [Limisphaera sp. 4302-co]|uniref:hypothetical protein n=1 Tax=Limisphaera sp. 4302-co TaxID=3400417 RepID=UPI003C1745CD